MHLFLSEPYLLTTKPQSEMSILWISSECGEGYVEFGEEGSLCRQVNAERFELVGLHGPREDGTYGDKREDCPAVSVWQYVAKIDALAPGQVVHYRAVMNGEATDTYFFHTAPEAGGDFKFVQLSDLQGLPQCNESVYPIGCMHPDFILYSGDATYINWRLDQWFDVGDGTQDEEGVKKAFFPCMQQRNGARLMQYAPTFICPGNHDMDDLRCYTDREFNQVDEHWNWSIYMQMFRPLYPDPDTTLSGKRFYSVDYADMHIISLNINRHCFWEPYEFPGWRLYDSIAPDSRQITWLREDLAAAKTKFKWVIQHFHILNMGRDVQFHLCAPERMPDGSMGYPHDHGGMLMDLYSEAGVNAVTFGHSHVYERYYRKSTHYIEAAYLSICFRREGDLPHPSGLLPIVADCSARSFLTVERRAGGLYATGRYTESMEVFDTYRIADEDGNSIPPHSY